MKNNHKKYPLFSLFPLFPFLTLSLLLTSCHYTDFLPYYKGLDKETNLPTFNEWREYMGANHELRSCYDITVYDWRVHVDQDKKKIDGEMVIRFTGVTASDTILLDLGRNFQVGEIMGSIPVAKSKRKKNALFVIFERPFTTGEQVELRIPYSGKPVNIAGQGPFLWKKDSLDRHFMGTVTQGIGPQYMMPCKDLLIDEPDSCFIRVSSVTNQVVAANGRLLRKEASPKGDIYHFALHNPINVYGLSLNIGSFVSSFLPYTDISGAERQIEIVSLDYAVEQAIKHYGQTDTVLAGLEQRWGIFPWWEDGCKIVQSTFSAMEHQSAISMGERFYNAYKGHDLTLVHELSHEWWGNLLTARDYNDAWLHEGFATYNEALFIEQQHDQGSFYQILSYQLGRIVNKRPVRKIAGVRYNSWANGEDTDIYNKGSLILHTVRRQMNDDDAFFAMLKEALRRHHTNGWTSQSFIDLVNEYAQSDFTALITGYLDTIDIPVLEVRKRTDESGKTIRDYRWAASVPQGFAFQVFAKVGDVSIILKPSHTWQSLRLAEGETLTINILDSGYFQVEQID